MTTPPVEPISESNESTVARCSDGMSGLMKARRIGSSMAAITHQIDQDHQRHHEAVGEADAGQQQHAARGGEDDEVRAAA